MNLAEEIKSRMNLQEEFTADGSELVREGKDLKCCCPFHGEDTPSCKVEPTHFVCFGGSCGAKGDAISYLTWQRYKKFDAEGAEFVQVLRDGYARLNLEFPETKKPNALEQLVLTAERTRDDFYARKIETMLRIPSIWKARACDVQRIHESRHRRG